MPSTVRALARRSLIALGLAVALATHARRAAAQAWFYPSFQPPAVVDRDYTFGVVASHGAAFLFQWREGIDADTHLSFDAGLVDPSGAAGTKLLLAGNVGRQLMRATNDLPLDLLLTAGLGVASGDGPDLLRIPVGLSVGHRFPLEDGMAITPYVHPRASLDVPFGTGGASNDRKLSLDFDVGASAELTPRLALRGSVTVTGNSTRSGAGIGVALTYRPAGLRR